MLPGMAGGIVRGRAAAFVLVAQLPERLTLQPAAVTVRAGKQIDLLALFDARGVVGIGEMRIVRGRKRLPSRECQRKG